MKKCFLFILSVIVVLTNLPAFAINGDTHVIPLIGPVTEKANAFVSEKIELATIKLPPKKIFKVELLEAERTFAPRFISNQFGIWSCPLRTKYKDLSWLVPAAGGLTALLLTDDDFEGALTNNYDISKTQRYISRTFAQIGGYAPTLGIPGGLTLTGFITKNNKLRETGVLQYKALAHATLVYLVTSRIAGRNKPNNDTKGKERGEFFEGGTSFPSGHALNSFALSSVLAHEYSDKLWVPILAYTISTIASSSRVLQGVHFPSDVFAGAVVGILIGRYVVKHNSKYAPGSKEKSKKEEDK